MRSWAKRAPEPRPLQRGARLGSHAGRHAQALALAPRSAAPSTVAQVRAQRRPSRSQPRPITQAALWHKPKHPRGPRILQAQDRERRDWVAHALIAGISGIFGAEHLLVAGPLFFPASLRTAARGGRSWRRPGQQPCRAASAMAASGRTHPKAARTGDLAALRARGGDVAGGPGSDARRGQSNSSINVGRPAEANGS